MSDTTVPSKTFNQLRRLCELPDFFMKYYRHRPDDEDFVMNEWTHYSMDKILTTYREREPRYLDVAIKYDGMGWYHLLAWDMHTKRFFIRLDGGSNDWDRKTCYEYYTNDSFEPMSTKTMTFQEFIEMDPTRIDNFIHIPN